MAKDWAVFKKNTNGDNFEEVEVDFVFRLSYKDYDSSSKLFHDLQFSNIKMIEPPMNVSIPFNLNAKNGDEGLCYEIKVENDPVIVCCQATKSPTNFVQKLWQLEKTIATFETLKNKDLDSIQSVDLRKLKKWINPPSEILYSIVSNENENLWMENFVSKLCIFNEQTSFDFAIVNEHRIN